jgi:predicted TIM-barrel fold metal-dependent hydrolase
MPMTVDEYIEQKVMERGRSATVTFIDEPEPEPLFCPIISVDDHSMEPANLFEKRLPQRMLEGAPKLITHTDGAPWWKIDDALVPILMSNGGAGRLMTEWALCVASYEEFRQGVWDSKARLHDLDLAGIWAQLCFGSIVWGFAGTRFSKMRDREVGYACMQAYNDWVHDEWCAADRNRYVPCQLTYMADAELGAKEVYRNAERGFHAVSFSENPEKLGFINVYDRSWDPFFRACEETGTVVNLHVGSSGVAQVPSTVSAEEVTVALFPVSGFEALIDWVYSGVPARFPNLSIALSEAGVSWVPMALERLRRGYRQSGGTGKGWPSDWPTPMELVKRNFYFTSIEDPSGFRQLDLIGEDHVMVETDYPHYDSTWPKCQDMIRGELSDLPAATVRKVCYENAARLYQHPLPPHEMIARSEVGLSDTTVDSMS